MFFIADGVFGAMMEVDITNDGPVTINLDSPPHADKPMKSAKQNNHKPPSEAPTTDTDS